jgi:hypothetical protein
MKDTAVSENGRVVAGEWQNGNVKIVNEIFECIQVLGIA